MYVGDKRKIPPSKSFSLSLDLLKTICYFWLMIHCWYIIVQLGFL
jgi:hypothetical protein